MNMDSLVIDIQSTSTDATKGIDTLITHLSNLRDVLKEVSTASNGLSNLKKIGNGVRASGGGKRPKIEQPQMLYKNIDVRPAFEKMAGDIGKVDSATSMLRNKFDTLGISLKDTKIISTFSDANKVITKYVTKTGSVITVTDKLRGAFNKVDVSVKKTNKSTKKFSDDFKKTTDIINKVNVALVGAVAGFVKLAQKVGDFVNQAGAEQEALNLFTVTMGGYAKQGVEWIEKFSDALYLDPVSVMQYMGSFNSLVKGLGVGAENSYKMSQNLTQLVYDLASFKNVTITSAYEKLMSGVSGELEPLRNVGVAMSEATLQTLAYELGIEKLVRNMTEAEKAQLRYIQIMRSSTEWQTDMGRTLITPTNALRVMRQQFTLLGRAIGKVFIPIVMEAIPYVIAITQLLTALANKIANLLGYKIADIDYSSLGEISAGIQDIGDSAEDTAHKLNTMLAPFDDLNVVQKNSDKSGSGLSAFGGDLGVDLPTYDALANLNTKFAEGVSNARNNLEKLLPIVIAIGGAFALWKIGSGVLTAIQFLSGFAEGGAIAVGVKTVASGFGAIGATLSSIVSPLTITIALIAGLLVGLKSVYDTNEAIRNQVDSVFGELSETLSSGFSILTESIIPDLKSGLTELQSIFKPFISFLNDTFTSIWNDIIIPALDMLADDVIPNVVTSIDMLWTNVLVPFGQFIGNILTPVINVLSSVFSVLWKEIITPIADFVISVFGEAFKTLVAIFKTIVIPVASSVIKVFSFMWDILIGLGTLVGNNLAPYFEIAINTISSLINNLKDIFTGLLQFIRGIFTNNWAVAWNGVINILSGIFGIIGNILKIPLNVAITMFEKAINNVISGYNSIAKIVNKIPGVSLPSGGKIYLPRFEDGGFPTSGDLFFANENGVPEMIGRIGNQTAVANNDQIATSLTNALISALNQYDFGGGQSPTTIYIGNRKVYEGYDEHVANENDRYGTNMIKI